MERKSGMYSMRTQTQQAPVTRLGTQWLKLWCGIRMVLLISRRPSLWGQSWQDLRESSES